MQATIALQTEQTAGVSRFGLLHSSVQVTITYHELGPAPLQDGGLQLSNAGCQCNWSEVDEQVGVRLSIMFAKQM